MKKLFNYFLVLCAVLLSSCSVFLSDLKDMKYDFSYKVEHYLQNVDGNGFNLLETEEFHGAEGSQTTVNAKFIPGFIVQPFQQILLDENDSKIVKIYYVRKQITYTFDLNGGSYTGSNENFVRDDVTGLYSITGLYGSPVNVPSYTDFVLDDASFFGEWQNASENTVSETFGTSNESFEAVWMLKTACRVKFELNDAPWNDIQKFNVRIINVSDSSKSFKLVADPSGKAEYYKVDIEAGTYNLVVNDKIVKEISFDQNLDKNSTQHFVTLSFYTVTLNENSEHCSLVSVSGAFFSDTNKAVVLMGNDFTYIVLLENFYVESENFAIKENNVKVENLHSNTKKVIASVNNAYDIKVENVEIEKFTASVKFSLDGKVWNDCDLFTVKLVNVNNPSKFYNFNLKSGSRSEFHNASVDYGTYYINVNGKNLKQITVKENCVETLYFYSVSFDENSPHVSFTVVNGAFSSGTNSAIVYEGNDFSYQINLDENYSETSKFAIKENGATVKDLHAGENRTILAVNKKYIIKVDGIGLSNYSITYVDIDGHEIVQKNNISHSDCAYWVSGFTAPQTFTSESSTVVLPTLANVRKEGKIFDSWVIKSGLGEEGNVCKEIASGSIGNIVLEAVWKDSVAIDNSNKIIYAKGISLIIADNAGATNIFVDFNSNGNIDSGDYQVISENGISDFTNYHLVAGNENASEIVNSDFTFTMKGGKIASIRGNGSTAVSKSVLNISGNSVIGSASNTKEVGTGSSDKTIYAKNVYGVDLSSITNKCLTINGAMNGDYNVVVISDEEYDSDRIYNVGFMFDSSWASFKNFTCYYHKQDNSDFTEASESGYKYKKVELTLKDEIVNGNKSTYIRLANPSGITLPAADKVIERVDNVNGFRFGSGTITVPCSVFSISVVDGYFKVGNTVLGENSSYLAQPDADSYEVRLSTASEYIYMHVLSNGNDFTAEEASEFLSNVTFFRKESNKSMTIKINLETIPSADIKEASVSYFDGSFYKRYKATDEVMTKDTNNSSKKMITWNLCYNAAKNKVFNGLHGYLMTVTSEVENNYIFKRMYEDGGFLIGAARYNTNVDSKTIPDNFKDNMTTGWYWVCGPEAGKEFYSTKKYNERNPSASLVIETDESSPYYGKYRYQNWNNKSNAGANFSGDAQPDDWGANWNGDEYCAQYLPSGYWNDVPNGSNGDNAPTGYIVEFRPYSTQYNTETAQYQAISQTQVY